MAVSLVQLQSIGLGKTAAVVDFRSPAALIRGPSETGKSYIRDCLWFLLGGDKVPKQIPEATGYDTLILLLDADTLRYEIRRALAGGETKITLITLGADGKEARETIDEEIGTFLVRMAGAEGKQLLRSRSRRGLVTGGDLRHWFLLSQPNVISEEATSGQVANAPQRIAAFHMFLTGTDDSAIELAKSSSELERIAGQIMGAEEALKRLRAELPSGQTKDEVAEALERVDTALGAMNHQYEARASRLRGVRSEILQALEEQRNAQLEHDHSKAMVERFELLDEKYRSDSERLGATWEGVAMFQALDDTPCPICATPAESQLDPRQLKRGAQDMYRKALKAELEKIILLRHGLAAALKRERIRVESLSGRVSRASTTLSTLEKQERQNLQSTRVEFSGDPKTLAVRRSELSEYLSRYDEEARLTVEIERLSKLKVRKHTPLARNIGGADIDVAEHAKTYLHAWGFTGVDTVTLNSASCDLVINGRARLDYGAGKRAIFLTAMTVAVMAHALGKGHPHLGLVLVDSPLKSYADPKSNELREITASTVTDRFYAWLAEWRGPGQVIILENQEIASHAKTSLEPTEFVGNEGDEGRPGFYPQRSETSEYTNAT
jgi:rubrerythrin